VFAKGDYRSVEGQQFRPTGSDDLWFALLSLENGAEFCREALRLDWQFPLRGWDNVDAVTRYGLEALPWIAAMLASGFTRWPHFQSSLEQMLISLGAGAAPTVTRVERPGDPDPDRLGLEWLQKHRSAAWVALANAATNGDDEAKRVVSLLMTRTPSVARRELKKVGAHQFIDGSRNRVSVETILRILDSAAASDDDERMPWPKFSAAAGHFEFHAMRLIAVRAEHGDEWGVLVEVIQGDVLDPDARWPATIQQYTYGSNVPIGGRYLQDVRALPVRVKDGALVKPVKAKLDSSLFERLDLRPGESISGAVEDATSVLAIRAALELARPKLFPHPRPLVTALKVPRPIVLVVCDAFEHVEGTAWGPSPLAKLPSQSVAWRSVAEAVVARDPKRFEPGTPNTDWRLHLPLR